MNARNPWMAVAAANGFVAVAAGAFAAHGLKSRLDADMLAVFETGAKYQMYHALALLLTALLRERRLHKSLQVAEWAFLAGIVLFSGSLYVLSLSGVKWLGAVTPFGGMGFLLGWLTLAVGALRTHQPSE